MQSPTRSLPLILEDRTGAYTTTDFDDIYDRAFFHVVCSAQRSVMVYPMTRRTSRHRDAHWQAHLHLPAAVLEFAADGGLGNISFATVPGARPRVLPMVQYLRKTGLFGRSLTRKFVCSDGREYKWTQGTTGPEWSCTTTDNFVVAQYDLKPADVRTYDVSGNSFTIYDGFTHLTLELLVSFIIMRHIQQYNL
ncbi:hypothetical protein MIND_00931800 [Mycena indigotica]|uniref:DUF6593 domain-containing protein n=1 Tax=Mycena indigotica TaxID=2126181 RepID=A0A8H6SFN7_9AGAR|nr:uncharacterized protein MIND_00931800 [Mycena indigotica]KAF7296995.1 hypothetical protein MIND_00931800 [Mycena indigotica]